MRNARKYSLVILFDMAKCRRTANPLTIILQTTRVVGRPLLNNESLGLVKKIQFGKDLSSRYTLRWGSYTQWKIRLGENTVLFCCQEFILNILFPYLFHFFLPYSASGLVTQPYPDLNFPRARKTTRIEGSRHVPYYLRCGKDEGHWPAPVTYSNAIFKYWPQSANMIHVSVYKSPSAEIPFGSLGWAFSYPIWRHWKWYWSLWKDKCRSFILVLLVSFRYLYIFDSTTSNCIVIQSILAHIP